MSEISKKELARELGVSQLTITNFFKIKNLILGTMTKVVEVIGCTYSIELVHKE